MNLSDVFSVYTLCVILVAGKPDPPKDIKINAIGKNANISWTIPIHQWKTTVIELFDSKERKVLFNSQQNHKYVGFPHTSYEIVNLTLCAEYVVTVQYSYRNQWSDKTKQHFWMTSKTFTADINQNVTLSWTTSLTETFSVLSSFNSTIIYEVHFGGAIIHNYKGGKYIFDDKPKDVKAINITVINVKKIDAGLYRAKKDSAVNVKGCCLLIVTTKPTDPTLIISPTHPFVNSRVVFTCRSMVQRWPEFIPSHLSYKFFGSTKDAENNRFIINPLTKSQKGMNISCQATDDLGKLSNMSKTITLDPYYGPDSVLLKPGHKAINVTEGTTLGPIICTATCNPKCIFKWEKIKTGKNTLISNETRLTLLEVTKDQAGTYRCRVVNSYNNTMGNNSDLSVNVQYSPNITSFWIGDDQNPTTHRYLEGTNPRITLRIDSNPDLRLTLNSSLFIVSPLEFTKQSKDFSTNLPSLKCENSGNFTIQARNGIAYGDNRTVNLIILCKPRDVKTERQIGAKVNNDVNIVMDVISFPAPNATWLRVTPFIWTVHKDQHNYRYKISSTMKITSEDAFGEHGIKICNTLGCIVENITFKPEDKPEAPINFTVETTTFRSANLSWIVGFNGGHEQIFSVQFKTTDGDGATNSVQTSDTKTGNKVYYILDQLKPDTLYHVMVLSTNKHGNRNASLEFKTEVEPTVKSPSKSASMTPIFIGIGCGIALILMIVIFLYMVFNKRNKRSTSEPTESNVLYAAVDKVQQKFKRRNTENEDTHMSNEPANAEYASVIKPKSKSKKVHYKEDEIETANDEYAVVDKSNRKINFTEDDTTYANQGDADLLIRQPSRTKPSGRRKNKDGLTYIEVSFTRKPKNRRVIIGAENRTNYVDIDFTRTADPLPETVDE